MARIVFDLDGTLIDSAPDICAIANGVLAPHGARITLAQTHAFIGHGVDTFVAQMRAATGLSGALHEEMVATFKRGYLTSFTRTEIYDGVVPVLGALAQEGHRLGICTNKPLAPCHAVLDHLDLRRHFGQITGGDSLPVNKPDPAPLDATFAGLGDGARLYVGDSEVDAQTAQRAGVPFLLFTRGYRKKPIAQVPYDRSFDDFAMLPALVADLLGAR